MVQVHSRRFEEHFRDQELIDEGLFEVEKNKREIEIKKLIDPLFEAAEYNVERMFEILSYIVFNNEFQLEEYELKEIVERLYLLTEGGWYDYESDEENGREKDWVETFNHWEKIYYITGIAPSKKLTSSDITSYEGISNIISHPDRIAFDLYKDDTTKIEKFKQNPKLLEPEVFSHNILLEKYSPEQIRTILFDVILYQKPDYLNNIYLIKKVKNLLPEFKFVLEKEKAEEFYKAVIFEYFSRNKELYPLFTINFKGDFQDIFEATGVPIDQISFDKKEIDHLYQLIAESWKDCFSNNSLLSSYLSIIPEFEKITHVPFDFSKYSEEIALCYKNDVERLKGFRKRKNHWQNIWVHSQGSYILGFQHEVECIEKITGQKAMPFDEVLLQKIYNEELSKFLEIYAIEFKNLDSSSTHTFTFLNAVIDRLREKSKQKSIFSEKVFYSMNDSLKRWCSSHDSLNSDEGMRRFEYFVSILEFLTSKPFRLFLKERNFESVYCPVLFSLDNIQSIDRFSSIVFDEENIRENVIGLVKHKLDEDSFLLGFEIMLHFGIRKEEIYAPESEELNTKLKRVMQRDIGTALKFIEIFIPSEYLESDFFKNYIHENLLNDPRNVVEAFEKNKSFLDTLKKNPWISGFMQIKKLQDISQNEKNDPWKLEFQPLFSYALSNKIIDKKNDKDIELVVEYIRRFGMCNLKRVFLLFVACTRANSWADIPEEMIVQCEEYGIRVRKQNEERSWRFAHPKLLLNELDKSLAVFQNELMSDNIPENINSDIGREQFSRMLGTTQWRRGDSVASLVNTWKKTLETEPSAALLPKGYQESTFVCNEISRSDLTVTEQRSVDEKLTEVFQSKEVKETYDPLAEAISVGLDKNVSEEFWKIRQEAILNFLQQKIDEVDKFLKATPEQFDVWIEQEKNEGVRASLTQKKKVFSSERGRIGIEKQYLQMVELSKKIQDLSFAFESEEAVVRTLEQLAPIMENLTILAALFREISAFHIIRSTAHLNWGESLRESFGSGLYPTAEKIAMLNSFLKQYVREHYLHKEQKQEHTSHIPFSETLRLALERIWKVQESRKGNIPLDVIHTKIDKILNPNGDVTSRQVEVSMVPVAGLLRIYAGDIGDACYTSQHLSLAENEFPDLHAWIYVTKRGTSQETLCGSMLGIQTVQESGAPTLVARANNPKENFIQGIDSEAFVIASLKEVIETAKRIRLARIEEAERQGILNVERRQCVVLPIDKVTASSTNREKVGKTYLRFYGLPKVGLRNQPETNFNNYRNWDKTGDRACSVIWEIDAEGKETYFGQWPE